MFKTAERCCFVENLMSCEVKHQNCTWYGNYVVTQLTGDYVEGYKSDSSALAMGLLHFSLIRRYA